MVKQQFFFNKSKKRLKANKRYTKRLYGGLAQKNPIIDVGRAYPAPGPKIAGYNFIVPQMAAGSREIHRSKCKCSGCKYGGGKQSGGSPCATTNGGLPYPNGILGKPWTPNVTTWPGIDGIAMNRNSLSYNNFDTVDLQTSELNIGAQPPFTYYYGGKKKISKSKKRRSKPFKGGFGALVEQIPYQFGSLYNGITGYPQPVNPLPYKDQLTRDPVSYNLYT